ncbi:MAG TPA: trigger factor [Gemmatimonadales bacterium]|nr:trigger factor [Gemmatimonadales bacterium]
MTTTIEIKKTGEGPGEAHLAVTIPLDRVREAEEAATRSYQARARLPGFRKGKAPSAIIKKQFAADIREHTLRDLVQRSWQVALEQEQLKPIADPHIHDLKWEEGTPLTFTFHVEVRPEIQLQRLGGFTVQRKVAPVTEDQVQAQLGTLREQRAPWSPVSGEPPKPKDLVKVTLGQREGDTVKHAEPYQIVLGEGQAIPDVEERILALRPEESVDATVRFPDDFPDADKRGQSRDVRITLHEVKRQQLPELTDEFAREIGDFDSLEALRTAIREDLRHEAEREADSRVRSEVLAQVVAANAVAAPRPLVDRVIATYGQAYGVPEDRFAQFATEFRPIAEQQVQRDLVLDWIVEHHQLRASEQEIDQRVQELAAKRKMPPAELYASLEKNKRLRDLERGLTEEKVFTFLLSQSTVEPA